MVNDKHPHEWAVEHDPLVVPLFLNLERARKVAHARARTIWDQHGLTPAEFDVLATLRNAEAPYELTPGQIQDRVLITSGGLTKVIHLLEEKKFVERSVARNDNRVKPVRLTVIGNRCVGRAMKDLVAMTQEWMHSILKADEIRVATNVLSKIAD
jgi:DNA-binding MarR family transcriptional regulator